MKYPLKPCPNDVNEIGVYPDVLGPIKKFKENGFKILGVSNQGGVELGYFTEKKCREIMLETNRIMDGVFDIIEWCSLMNSDFRKPNPGMIFKLQKTYDLDLLSCVMVGDSHSDLLCALNAGIGHFFFANDFFRR